MSSEMPFSYKTISDCTSSTFTEKRSRFLAFAYRVESEDEAKQIIDEKRREFYDARHVCWAYVIGKRETIERMNDDGEPSSTAGKPIHGQIISRELTDTLVIVVRYFGGVKLGTGGLIVAYRTAAAYALDEAEIIETELEVAYRLKFGFDLINPIMMLLKQHDANTVSTDTDVNGYIIDITLQERYREAFEAEASEYYALDLKLKE